MGRARTMGKDRVGFVIGLLRASSKQSYMAAAVAGIDFKPLQVDLWPGPELNVHWNHILAVREGLRLIFAMAANVARSRNFALQ
jgi:hypothetical protein